ncbi:protease inhibitor I42 family protein [Telmatobacter bradus]|uniref:protease inhibitor I42 family protein n=1 Tax=Telmatobacter bradus TaxID=474953 RepID=UPI003B43644F
MRLLLRTSLLALLFASGISLLRAEIIHVTGADSGKTAHLKSGDQIEVQLISNLSTGYSWSTSPASTPLLRMSKQSQGKPGKPGIGRPFPQTFLFRTTGSGQGQLVLHSVRTWEQPNPHEKQFTLLVQID